MGQRHVENIMFTVEFMHPTTRRLYEALQDVLGIKDVGSTLAAKTLGLGSAQTVNNWEERGVSNAGMVKASSVCGIRTAWIEREELPMLEPIKKAEPSHNESQTHQHVAEPDGLLQFSSGITQALDTLEAALVRLDISGRERIAPFFESFARSPGPVIKADITVLLRTPNAVKSYAAEKADLQKTG